MSKTHKKLGTLASTAISGNDISSSVLYVSALAIFYAGQYAFITLGIVAFVLFFFRKIYGEVVGALPLNGGAYNALLNTTNKGVSSMAATLTLLSYMATAVISAYEAMHYISGIFRDNVPANFDMHLAVELATILLLGVFALLTINGITESAKVAIGIFIFHLVSIALLSVSIIIYIFTHGGFTIFMENWNLPTLEGVTITQAIFLGFAASMLGISGFESSANFVEEQEKGIFPKTLKYMWIVVSIINPLIAFLALSIFSVDYIRTPEVKDGLLAIMGDKVAGGWLEFIVSVDAGLVLSGAVLTAFVGVTGLLERMTLDRILPQVFLKKNKKGSSYVIILMFLLLCISVLLITNGNVILLAGVYTISFLAVMTLFVVGNVLLKVKRRKLPRPERAPYYGLLIAFIGVVVALAGNIKDKPEVYLRFLKPEQRDVSNWNTFLWYFIPTMILIFIMLNRIALLKLTLNLIRSIFEPIRKFTLGMNKSITETIDKINSQEFVFFTKDDNIAILNKVMLYVKNNEHTHKIKIVTMHQPGQKVSDGLIYDIDVLDREYPEIKIEFLQIEGNFGPEIIKELSEKWNIPINFMFIGSPSEKFPYRLEDLGGVRLII